MSKEHVDMSTVVIEMRDIVKKFGNFTANDGINLTVHKGEIHAILGENGAGKSTVIRHILGIYKQDSGEVLIDGEGVWENNAVKQRCASIPDDWYYFANANIKEMMSFYKGMYKNFSEERYEKLKEVFPIDESKTIRYLSKGMQKQVAFWLALSTMPDYMILDEPVDGLDPVMRRQVWSSACDIEWRLKRRPVNPG